MIKCTVEDDSFIVTIELKDEMNTPMNELYNCIKQACQGVGCSEATIEKWFEGE